MICKCDIKNNCGYKNTIWCEQCSNNQISDEKEKDYFEEVEEK